LGEQRVEEGLRDFRGSEEGFYYRIWNSLLRGSIRLSSLGRKTGVTRKRLAMNRGIRIDDLPQPIMNTVAGLELFEGVSKNRAMRRMWARIVKERFGAKE
jgi:hypothetical protein